MKKIPREQLERVCRMYNSRTDAAKALGISPTGLSRALKSEGLEGLWSRKQDKPSN